jgi:transglutaminase-like putative cysteine protease
VTENLQATYFIDSDHPRVREWARQAVARSEDPVERTKALFLAVRDGFPYDPYRLDLRREALRASEVLQRPRAYCVEKAIVLAAALRSLEIPARLFFGNVRNHIGTGRLEAYLKTDVLAFHGCTEVFLNGRWLKITPAFNKELCARLGVTPLEFDGSNEAVFQEYGGQGQRFMEYLVEHGSFSDMPYELYLAELRKHYGHTFGDTEELVFDFTGKV